ncbi:P pilus assembly protein, chaperone PapD [Enterobacter cloacae]|uniref:P pilus assembly protein, chaperone PapD n=1 Tax=Enterobacter cloacae TaxID=550 RepID=A0A377LR50_ENTCL|nr:P pilus assembly protein, chaperone PapD [Enterobacter cloacae]
MQAGVGLGATRMVYSSTTNQSMLQVRNTHPDATFLIQSWMENEEGQKTNDFVITPPLFVMKPASESAVKIMFNGKALPEDRETLYWMTVKAIPQQTKSGSGNSLQFASQTASRCFIARRALGRAQGRLEKPDRSLSRAERSRLATQRRTTSPPST